MAFICVVPVHLPQESLLIPLLEHISSSFHRETRIVFLPIDPSFAYDHSRKQHNSSLLLAKLVDIKPKDALRIVGVTDLDLFIPILTFVFGEAQLSGPASIVSTQRLRNEFYGLPKNDGLLQQRLEKEAIHELGHTFGLVHCRNDLCVMRPSTYVENIDLKPPQLCYSCLKTIDEKLKAIPP
ncbi:MAG: archaemetzincin family Zn-dependent metalloprotease [Gemmatimonadota bacterium]|nr:MAG: archaemetzincin family Zn-dependent metalloprotease [Gemmatimonadota bacterium]